MKTVLAPNAPWPYKQKKKREPAPKVQRTKEFKPRKKGRDIDKRYIEWAARTLGDIL